MQTASPRQTIARLDRQIDAIRAELLSKVPRFNQLCSHAWQAAWDQFPDLRKRECDLYRQRGEAQVERDTQAAQMAAKAARTARLRKRKCPACGVTSYAKAA